MSYKESVVHGVVVYLCVLVVGSLMFGNDSTFSGGTTLIMTLFVGPFYFIPFLAYPAAIVVAMLVVTSRSKNKLAPSFVSSSFMIYSCVLLYSWEVLEVGHGHKQFIVMAVVSCACGYYYARYFPGHDGREDDDVSEK
jgi:hypothetical protein